MTKYNQFKTEHEWKVTANLKAGTHDFKIFDDDGNYLKSICITVDEDGRTHVSLHGFGFDTSNVKKQTLDGATAQRTDCKWFSIGNKNDHIGGTTFRGDHMTVHDSGSYRENVKNAKDRMIMNGNEKAIKLGGIDYDQDGSENALFDEEVI